MLSPSSLSKLVLQCLFLIVILVENLSYAFAPTRKCITTTTNKRPLFQQQSNWCLQQQQQNHLQKNHNQLVYFASSINDDGDFVIPGINDENMMISTQQQPTSSSFSDNGAGQLYVSSLLDKQNELSTTTPTTSASSNSKNSNVNNRGQKISSETASTTTTELLGLTEDGDFLMSGINAPTEIQQQQESLLPTPQPSLGIPDLSIENNNNNNNINNIMMPKNPFAEILELSSLSEDNTKQRLEMEQEECDTEDLNICIVEEFLTSIIPSLDQHDSHRYATKLVTELGFDPDCESSQELTLDDLLGFMKKLHARYFWKEWTKLIT